MNVPKRRLAHAVFGLCDMACCSYLLRKLSSADIGALSALSALLWTVLIFRMDDEATDSSPSSSGTMVTSAYSFFAGAAAAGFDGELVA